jgi:hypothetical protein
MKKLILSLFCLCFFAVEGMAQTDLTSAQKTFQGEIIQFLKKEGYTPTIDDEGSIYFKSEGEEHWIRIFFDAPTFVFIQRAGYKLEGEDGLDRAAAMKACNTVNKEMNAVKFYCTDNSVVFCTEQFVRWVGDFTNVLQTNLRVLADGESRFVEEYRNNTAE